ncbi:hypothetical protein DEO72_LG11g900 [Vigna unguiculata]|uniref:Uncharacterized protein n=1 Tax=Vigna unguiculata TaxID=3917 RepID=A0A4D6NLI5_VIGUN|nr:hypothetical protein DEO72_LG11g900 [Vigna unguiculata]
MKGRHPTLVNEQRDIAGSRRKQQNLLQRFEATVNMVTTTNDSNMPTQLVQLEVIDELQLSQDNSDSSNSHVEDSPAEYEMNYEFINHKERQGF